MNFPSFLRALFDFSFEEMVTPRAVQVLYALVVVVAVATSLVFFLSMAVLGLRGFLTGLVLAPMMALLYIAVGRVVLELALVAFRIAEHTREIAERGRDQRPSDSPA